MGKYFFIFTIIFGWITFAEAEILWQENFESTPINESGANGNFTNYAPESHTPGSQTGEDLCDHCGNYAWKYARQANSGYQDRTGWALGAAGNYQVGNTLHYRMYVKFSSAAAFQCGSSGCEYGVEYKFPDFKTEAGDRPILKWRSGGQVNLYSSATGVDIPEENQPHVQAGKWYVVEFMMHDNGNNDIGRIWVASEDDGFQYTEANPSGEEVGNIFSNSAGWDGNAAWWAWYFANHDTPQNVDIYVDNFAIGNSFIGPAGESAPPPEDPPPDEPELVEILIEGSQTIPENSTAQFTLQAIFDDTTRSLVNDGILWKEDCGDASISDDGVLTTEEVNIDTSCTVSAEYALEGAGAVLSDSMDITIEDNTIAQVLLDRIEIRDSDGEAHDSISMDEESSRTFTCLAYYSDGTNLDVTNGTSWLMEPTTDSASIIVQADQCILETSNLDQANTIELVARFTEGGVTKEDRIEVTIINTDTSPYPSTDEVILDNGDPGTHYSGSWRTYKGESFGNPSVYCPYRKKGTYTFSTELYGAYEVSFRWVENKGKNDNVEVKIDGVTSGNEPLVVTFVNQTQNPGEWNPIGIYTFNGPVNVTVVAKRKEPAVSVDGMKFSPQ